MWIKPAKHNLRQLKIETTKGYKKQPGAWLILKKDWRHSLQSGC